MKTLIVVPIMGNLNESKPFWSTLLNNVVQSDLLIVDNAPDVIDHEGENKEPKMNQVAFFGNFVKPFWPGEVYYHPQPTNIGVIKAMQYAYEKFDHDILAFIHNDLYIHFPGWDHRLMDYFITYDKPGLFGFFGAEGIHPSSGRFNVYSRMLEAEIHGRRSVNEVREVAVLDGMSMIASRKMLDARGGVDIDFDIHHFYDLDLSLESVDRGFRNYIWTIPIHHQSGQTACRPLFNDWANKYTGTDQGQDLLYQKNKNRWIEKWARKIGPSWQVGQPWPAR